MKKLIYTLAYLLSVVCYSENTNAQSVREELTQLMRDDSVDINTLALYPSAVREEIFLICTHSEGIARIDDAQKRSQESFRSLISSYTKEEQEKIWNLTRYKDLIAQLAASKGKQNKIEKLLENYPPDVHADALEYGSRHKDLIVSLDKMNKEFNLSFDAIVSSYPASDQAAFRDMLNKPEAFSLLSKNMHMVVHLGDVYKADPALMRNQFDSLNVTLAEEKAREVSEWKQEMKENPEAESEMKQSANEYADQNATQGKETSPSVVEHYVYIPYPYWSGYPYWYDYPYWYPYPYWYHTGFYYWNGEVVWIGPPSWYYVHWHFHHHPHFYHYPHITNLYINHYYYGPRRTVSRNSVEVHNWMRNNEGSFPRDFKLNTVNRIDRIKEFGKAEIDRDNYHKNNPGKIISRDSFIKEHADEYPHLKQAVVETPVVTPKPETNPSQTRPGEKPKEKQEIKSDRPKSNPPVIKKDQGKSDRKEPVNTKPSQTPRPRTVPAQPRKQETAPTPTPSKPVVPSQQQNKKQGPVRKK